MKISRLFSFTAIVLIIIFGLHLVQNLWIWIGLIAVSGILPGKKWNFGRYFLTSAIAIAIYFVLQPPDFKTLEIMGRILPLGATGYLIASVIFSSLVFALFTNTIKTWTRPLIDKPKRRY